MELCVNMRSAGIPQDFYVGPLDTSLQIGGATQETANTSPSMCLTSLFWDFAISKVRQTFILLNRIKENWYFFLKYLIFQKFTRSNRFTNRDRQTQL